MSIRSTPGSARPGYPQSAERIQREHELNAALEAARGLQARLEMLADRRADVEAIRLLRDSLATDLGRTTLPDLLDDSAFTSRTTASPNDDGSSS